MFKVVVHPLHGFFSGVVVSILIFVCVYYFGKLHVLIGLFSAVAFLVGYCYFVYKYIEWLD